MARWRQIVGLFLTCGLVAGAFCSLSTTACAVEPDAPGKIISRLDAVVLTLLSKLEARFRNGQGGLNRHDHGALVEFYSEPNRTPLWVDENGLTKRARDAVAELNSAADYGLKPGDYETPEAGGLARHKGYPSEWLAQAELRLSVSVLAYARHAQAGRVAPLSLGESMDLDPHGPDPFDVLTILARTEKAVGAQLRSYHPRHPQFEALRRQLIAARGGQGRSGLIPTILINMERWRWEPREFGDFHVWVNIPEFMVRVRKNGQTVHEERVVAGKLDHQTPVLSRHIEYIEFNPYWNVPPSIMTQEILPMLRRDPDTLSKHQLEVYWQGRRMDSQAMDWTRVDPGKISMKQPPGQGNVLGSVKFGFPNRHDVYMHDTPTKQLFNNTVRAESHGCMRVRNPLKLAEVLLAVQGQGWNGGRIQRVIEDGDNQTVHLNRRIPIHLTYFTAWVDQNGRLATFRDVYGHDPRLRAALRF